jgi:hypothetical protein
VWISRDAATARWHYEAELALQSGRSSALSGGALVRNLDHEASFAHVKVGYSFDARMSPRFEVELDVASGDSHPDDARNERFDPLFGARRFDFGPTGIYGPFARANLRSYGVRGYLKPAERFDAIFVYRSFSLESASDAWTTTLLRDPSGQSGRSLGRQFEFSLAWRPAIERLRFELGGARLSKGSFVSQTAADLSATSNYYYVSTTILFLGAARG